MTAWLAALESDIVVEAPSVLARLTAALMFGLFVAALHQRFRPTTTPSFGGTLVMLSVLIAMVTQVIGDNVARAFSLVGALSIVRFRTVVRDTLDTAYVIFAVAVGMACGAADLVLAAVGAVVTVVAVSVARSLFSGGPSSALEVRIGLGVAPEAAIGTVLQEFCSSSEQLSAQTARQGGAIEIRYYVSLRAGRSPHQLVTALNRCEGVHGAAVQPDLAQQ